MTKKPNKKHSEKKTLGKKLFKDWDVSPTKKTDSTESAMDIGATSDEESLDDTYLKTPKKIKLPEFTTPTPNPHPHNYGDIRYQSSRLIRADYDDPATIRKLLEEGEDINYQNELGISALHNAKTPKTALLLLQNGASISSINNKGKTPLDYMKSNMPRFLDVLKLPLLNFLQHITKEWHSTATRAFSIKGISDHIASYVGADTPLLTSEFKAPINNPLWYTDQQIFNILQETLHHERIVTLTAVQLLTTAQLETEARVTYQNLLTDAIEIAIQAISNGQIAVIPIHVNQNHWFAALLSINRDGVVQLTIQDSLGNRMSEHPNMINFIDLIRVRISDINIVDVASIQQENGYDCGVWTVDNLVRLAQAALEGPLPNNQQEIVTILSINAIDPSHIRTNHHDIDNTVSLSSTDGLSGKTSIGTSSNIDSDSDNEAYNEYFNRMTCDNVSITSTNPIAQQNATAAHPTVLHFPQLENAGAGVGVSGIVLGDIFSEGSLFNS